MKRFGRDLPSTGLPVRLKAILTEGKKMTAVMPIPYPTGIGCSSDVKVLNEISNTQQQQNTLQRQGTLYTYNIYTGIYNIVFCVKG